MHMHIDSNASCTMVAQLVCFVLFFYGILAANLYRCRILLCYEEWEHRRVPAFAILVLLIILIVFVIVVVVVVVVVGAERTCKKDMACEGVISDDDIIAEAFP